MLAQVQYVVQNVLESVKFHKMLGPWVLGPLVFTYPCLGQAKLIHSLSSEIFQKAMRVGGHFSYFIVQLIALLK